MGILNRTEFVSVLCHEKGGRTCHVCVSLPQNLECGWCEAAAICTAKSQCDEASSWMENGSPCPQESLLGLFLFLTVIFVVIIFILCVVFAICLVNKFTPKKKMKPPAMTLVKHETAANLSKPTAERNFDDPTKNLYAMVDKDKKRSKNQFADNCGVNIQRVSRISCDLIMTETPNDFSLVSNSSLNTPTNSTLTSTTASVATTVRHKTPDYEALNTTQNGVALNPLAQILPTLNFLSDQSLMSRSLTSEQLYQVLNATSSTLSDDLMSQSLRSNDYQYLAEAPFSCQTSIVPMTRNQFYLVLQINMNAVNNNASSRENDVTNSQTSGSSSSSTSPPPLPPPRPRTTSSSLPQNSEAIK